MTSSSSFPNTRQTVPDSEAHIEWNVQYDSTCSLYTHPRHIAALALVTGHQPPPIEGARILELGCATGGNLTPIAMSLPHNECIGIDPFEAQIENARQRAEKAQVYNVKYLPIGVSDIDQLTGSFDYIIAHGLFSWISDAHREDTLKLCQELLSPQGIAYISYNTYPHWHFEQSIRSLLRWQHRIRGQRFSADQSRDLSDPKLVREARGLLSVFARYSKSNHFNVIQNIYQQATEKLNKLPDWYVVHEYLLENNRAFYFDEWVEMASRFDLHYLGDAASNTELTLLMMPAALRRELQFAQDDPIMLQQGVDFLTNRSLRRSIVCHAAAKPTNISETPLTPWTEPGLRESELFDQLFVSSRYQLEGVLKDLNDEAVYQDITTPHTGPLLISDPFENALLLLLSSTWPNQLSLRETFNQAELLLREFNLWKRNAENNLQIAFHILLCQDIISHPTWGPMTYPDSENTTTRELPLLSRHLKSTLRSWPQSFTNYHHTPSFPSETLHWLISNYTVSHTRAELTELLARSTFAHVSLDEIFQEAKMLGLLSSTE